ncbi:MAG: hypothetical protein ACJ8MR_01275 [Povalibacter sp.]
MGKVHAGAVLFTTRMDLLADFYQHVLELSVRKRTQEYVVLESRTFSLTLHLIPEQHAKHIRLESPPRIRQVSAIKLSLPVASIARSREQASHFSGCVYQPDQEWTYEGTRVCDGWDPDGNVFQIFETAHRQ